MTPSSGNAEPPVTEAGRRLLDWFGGPMRPGESRNLSKSIRAIEREAAHQALAADRARVREAFAQIVATEYGQSNVAEAVGVLGATPALADPTPEEAR